jgi:hypothetical protein
MNLDDVRKQWRADILRLAERHGARNVRVFGSVARNAETTHDLDLLVDFAPGRSLLDLIGFEQDLEAAIGVKVDVVTEDGVSPYLRDDILKQAVPL